MKWCLRCLVAVVVVESTIEFKIYAHNGTDCCQNNATTKTTEKTMVFSSIGIVWIDIYSDVGQEIVFSLFLCVTLCHRIQSYNVNAIEYFHFWCHLPFLNFFSFSHTKSTIWPNLKPLMFVSKLHYISWSLLLFWRYQHHVWYLSEWVCACIT